MLHLVHLLLLPALREDRGAVARADRRIEHVLLERREHVERDHLRPHIAVVAGGVIVGDVAERRWERGSLDVAQWRGAFKALPYRERRLRIGRYRHVVRGIEPFARVANALPDSPRRLHLRHLRLREARAIGAYLPEDLER